MAPNPRLSGPQCGEAHSEEDRCPTCGMTSFHSDDRATRDRPIPSVPTMNAQPPITPPEGTISELSRPKDIPRLHPLFWGRGRTLFGIFITNACFTILTLGIYVFWGRVRVRQFLHSQTSFAKMRFAYHGTGKELLLGWSKAFLVFGLPYLFLSIIPVVWPHIPEWLPNLFAGALILCFIPVAVVGAHRYRLSRTSLGAIRFSFRGQCGEYFKIWILGSLLTVLTVGFYYPIFENRRRHFLVSHTYFGTHPFRYQGTGKGMAMIYAKAVRLMLLIVLCLLAISTDSETLPHLLQGTSDDWKGARLTTTFLFGLSGVLLPWFYLQVAKQRYVWNHTGFGDADFHFSASIWHLMELRFTNFFMLLLTLGLAWSWVQIRNLQFLYYHLSLPGSVNFQTIHQEAMDASPTGEGLAGFFDIGFDIG